MTAVNAGGGPSVRDRDKAARDQRFLSALFRKLGAMGGYYTRSVDMPTHDARINAALLYDVR